MRRLPLMDLVLSLLGTLIVSINIPWVLVLNDTIPAGGDNPAHPVLMKSIGAAFFSHFKLIHYSYDFWSGFEAFQFYFPLPYLIGSALSQVASPNVAYKLITVFGVVFLPCSFYWMASFLNAPRISRIAASFLAVPFLYTEAHVMWGGNIFSALAGMSGNAWAFVFFPLAFGATVQAYEQNRFSWLAVLFSVLAALSHFYAFLMLCVLFLILGLIKPRNLRSHCIPALSVILMAWWMLPLIYYKSWSVDLAGDWNISLLSTFSAAEKYIFVPALLLCGLSLTMKRFRTLPVLSSFLFGLTFVIMFFTNDIFNSTAFLNARLWPSIYFSLYLMIILAFSLIEKRAPLLAMIPLLCSLYFLLPSDATFNKARSWMEWNNSGLEDALSWPEMKKALDLLNKEKTARISYESDHEANAHLKSVRMPEIIPQLTHHELALGGIVNSAPYSGIGYFLMCLSSSSCAGWAAGSAMPDRDIPRSIDMMRALGINYHFAFSEATRAEFSKSKELETVFSGNRIALFRLRKEAPWVEVYSEDLLQICSPRVNTNILNSPRWDALRNAGMVFKNDCAEAKNVAEHLNFLIDQWNAGHRVKDLGWKTNPPKKLNTFVFFRRKKADLQDALKHGMEFLVMDRGFDPDLVITSNQAGYSEVAAPVLRSSPGQSRITFTGTGYRVFDDGIEIPLSKETSVDFPHSFKWFVIKPTSKKEPRYIEMHSSDPLIRSGLPGRSELRLPQQITEKCSPALEKSFHKMILRTNCPGKPHIIKYSYYPKWKADVEIHLATNGFMALTPKQDVTVIEHRLGWLDRLSMVISSLGFLALLTYGFSAFFRSRR